MHLLSPLALRDVHLRNRVGMAPMTTYMGQGFLPTPWHISHYGTRAMVPGLVIVEATAVSQCGAVTPHDLGLWNDVQETALKSLAAVIADGGAVPGLQLSHGGRKGSRSRYWDGDAALDINSGGWAIVGPSDAPFADGYIAPQPLEEDQIQETISDFVQAAKRALRAGFRFLELHAGHGRLFHSFYSPLSNSRSDAWGGSFEGRVRLLRQTVRAVRGVWPSDLPLAVRLSTTDWLEDGWTIDDSVMLSSQLASDGADLIDCSSGGVQRPIRVPVKANYQVPFSAEIRRKSGIATAAVGLIGSIEAANQIVDAGDADIVLLGRPFLLDPFFMLRELIRTGADVTGLVPAPYSRGTRSLSNFGDEFQPEL